MSLSAARNAADGAVYADANDRTALLPITAKSGQGLDQRRGTQPFGKGAPRVW
ncbi:MAG: hypothetical protein II939_09595 [Bacteroidales bacterium]|nr:hypothetical protein [Bacteroidales bacterium]